MKTKEKILKEIFTGTIYADARAKMLIYLLENARICRNNCNWRRHGEVLGGDFIS